MLASLFRKRRTSALHLVVSVGSGSVAVSIVSPGGVNAPARIWDYKRASLGYGDEQSGKADLDALAARIVELVRTTGEEVLNKHLAQKRPPCREVSLLLHPPWAEVATCEHETVYDTARVITPDEVSSVARSSLANCKPPVEPFEKSVVHIELNGYATVEPEGKQAHRIRVVSMVGWAGAMPVTKLRETMAALVPTAAISIQSAAHATMTVLSSFARRNPQLTVFNVASEATSILVIDNGALTGAGVAPLGWRELVRNLALKHKTTPEEALSRLRMTIEESCTDAQCAEVLSSLNDASPAFTASYAKVLAEMLPNKKAATAAIVIAPPDIAAWFQDLLGRVDFAQTTNTAQPFSARTITAEDLATAAIFAPGVLPDAGVALSAAFVHMRSLETNR